MSLQTNKKRANIICKVCKVEFCIPLWKKERDKVCRIADVNCGGRLEAHHILGWTKYPELRYDIKNGITLCHAHHPRKRSEEAKLSPYFQKLVAEMK